MKTFKYTGDKNAPENINFMGRVKFTLSETSDVEDEHIISKLENHPSFKEVGDAKTENDEVSYKEMVAALSNANITISSRKKEDVVKQYEELLNGE